MTTPRRNKNLRNLNIYGFTEAQDDLSRVTSKTPPKNKEEKWNLSLEHLRHIGIILVLNSICANLKIIRCNVKSLTKYVEPPHALFSWNMDDFLRRIQIRNDEYITEFQQTNKEAVNFVKLKKDIESIIDLLNTFIVDVTQRQDLTRVEEKLGTVVKLLKLQATIFNEKEKNESISKLLSTKLKNFPKEEDEKIKKWVVNTNDLREGWQDNRLIFYPIKSRYIISWGDAQVSQLQQERQLLHESYLSQIREYRFKFLREQECFANIQEAYKGEISSLNKKIQAWQETYDKDYEVRDFELTRKRAELEEITTNLIKYQNQYEMYDKKIAKYFAQKEAEEAERAWKAQIEMSALQEEEDAAAAAAASKKGKKDKKGKGKKDKKGKGKK